MKSYNIDNYIRWKKDIEVAISKLPDNEKSSQKVKALKEISIAEARIQAAKN